MRRALFIILLVGIAGVCTAQVNRHIVYTDSKGIERSIVIDLPDLPELVPGSIEIKRPDGRTEGSILYIRDKLFTAGLQGGISVLYSVDGPGSFRVTTQWGNGTTDDRATIEYDNWKLTRIYSRREDESIETLIKYEDDILQLVRTERPNKSVEAGIVYLDGRIAAIGASSRDNKPQAAISYAGGYPVCGL